MNPLLFFSACILGLSSFSQSYLPGTTYFGQDSLIEYQAGNLPIILSAPHGGHESPATLPDRNCSGCVTVKDSYTQELAREIAAALIFKTGCYPHLIINKLHRKKLDANREIIEATDSNSATEVYWHNYMNFIDSAKRSISSKYQKGIFLDIHGHGHAIQRIELGYLLSSSDLRKSDSVLNSLPTNLKTSILNLRYSTLTSQPLSELIRGKHSFGSLINAKGFPTVPSDSIPFPLVGEPYFNGGYNTRRFGSQTGGTIDAIQIEHNWDVRANPSIRARLADSLAQVILDFLELHYFTDFSSYACNYFTGTKEYPKKKVTAYPNPFSTHIELKEVSNNSTFSMFSQEGMLVMTGTLTDNFKVDLSHLSRGIYYLTIRNKTSFTTLKLVKCS